MTSPTFAIRSVQAFCYRYPLSTPVVTSFGRMLDRPAVFVRVEDDDGHVGWGEVWANFPSTGAEHRARLVNEVLAPAISGFAASEPSDVFESPDAGDLGAGAAIRRARAVRAGDRRNRSRGLGSLCAPPQHRRCGNCSAATGSRDQGLCQRHQSDGLAADGGSGAGPRASRAEIEGRLRSRGRPRQSRLASPTRRRRHAGRRCQPGLVDRRRRWRSRPHLSEFDLAWLEEPIRADRPWQEWQALRKGVERAARGGRKHREPGRLQAGARRRRVAGRSARYRQMGRPERRAPASRAIS